MSKYAAILELHKKNKPVDLVTLVTVLDDKNILERCGGIAYVSDLGNSVATAANAENHAALIKEAARKRRIIAAGTDMIAAAYNGQEDADAILGKGDKDL